MKLIPVMLSDLWVKGWLLVLENSFLRYTFNAINFLRLHLSPLTNIDLVVLFSFTLGSKIFLIYPEISSVTYGCLEICHVISKGFRTFNLFFVIDFYFNSMAIEEHNLYD